MAKLSEVVGILLSNLTQAQAEANKTTVNLAEIYANDAHLRYFLPPNIEIQSIQFALKVGIKGISTETNEVDIIVATDELVLLPIEAISTLNFTLNVKGYAVPIVSRSNK